MTYRWWILWLGCSWPILLSLVSWGYKHDLAFAHKRVGSRPRMRRWAPSPVCFSSLISASVLPSHDASGLGTSSTFLGSSLWYSCARQRVQWDQLLQKWSAMQSSTLRSKILPLHSSHRHRNIPWPWPSSFSLFAFQFSFCSWGPCHVQNRHWWRAATFRLPLLSIPSLFGFLLSKNRCFHFSGSHQSLTSTPGLALQERCLAIRSP